MKYLKTPITEAVADRMRINLSVKQDALEADPGLPDYPQHVRLSPEPLCDWCGEEQPVCTYASSRMSTGEYRQCWRWNACERCSRMVDNDNWDAIERRITARFKKFFGAKLADRYGHVPESMIAEAVQASLKLFHDYAVRILDTDPGSGKTVYP